MISLLEIAQNINEVDDEKVIKYKKKDGESGEMKAGSAKSMPKDHPAKLAWDKMQDDGGDDSEKDSDGKLGGGDFDRDGGGEPNPIGDKGDVPIGQLPDPSTRQGDPEANKAYQAKKAAKAKAAEKPKAEPKAKNKFGVSDDQYLGQTDGPGHRDVTVKQALAYDGDNSTMKF